jgi:pimeloyl-ACP methyl ester carboxylesterase
VKKSPVWIALAGIVLLAFGAVAEYVSSRPYSERHVVANAGSCRLDATILQRKGLADGAEAGNVVLFHGLAANKVIMTYLARAFAELNLRVYMPDSPGHGRSAGPFTPDFAEECGMSFVRGLAARGLIRPDRTILAGHSMGAAIALRVAAKFRPAGVVAISPAPMKPANGVSPELLLYHSLPALQPNTLIVVGKWEPFWLRANAAELAATTQDSTVQFVQLPMNSHVSILFSPTVARLAQEWSAKALQFPSQPRPPLPSRSGLLGGLWGLAGILLIAGPFIRETIGKHPAETVNGSMDFSPLWPVAQFAAASLVVVVLLRYVVPLKAIHLFEGDYLASFFLIVGLIIVLLHAKLAQAKFRIKPSLFLAAVLAGLLLHLLLSGWLQLTLTGAWLSLDRWTRFPLFFMSSFLFLYGLELVLGPVVEGETRRRFLLGLGLVVIAWLGLTFGVMVLHSGEILLVLLSPYFALIFLTMGMGAQLVRKVSGSATAAAVFGAILLAGYCLVIFPVS